MTTYIVTRHAGAIRWLNQRGITGKVIGQWSEEIQLSPIDVVIGVLPLGLIKSILLQGSTFILLSLPSAIYTERGNEITPDEMDKAGARLDKVLSIELQEIKPIEKKINRKVKSK